MNERTPKPRRRAPRLVFSLALVCAASLVIPVASGAGSRAQNPTSPAGASAARQAPRTPSETVREFHRALRERRFREAFALSVLHYAVKELDAKEFDDFRTDFERIAAGMPTEDQLTGEQISGEEATVFMNFGDAEKPDIKPVELIRQDGAWIVGSRKDLETVKKGGKKYLFEERIARHHEDARTLLNRIVAAEFVYASQHGGAYGDLNQLVDAALMPKDLLGTETTGYSFRITLGKDAKSYAAFAEPARHGRTGRLSYFIDQSGQLQSKDTGGKPLKPSK